MSEARYTKRKSIPTKTMDGATTLTGEAVGGNIVIDKLKDAYYFLTRKFRNHLSSDFKNTLIQYGEKYIVQIQIVREPLNKAIQTLGNLLTLGKLKQAQKKYQYNNLFHLYAVLYFGDGTKILLEKTNVPRLSKTVPSIRDKDGVEQINFQPTRQIKLIDFINDTIKVMGDLYFRYNLINNNCQIFLDKHLDANGINNQIYKHFILQDAGELLKAFPFKKPLNNVLDFATRLDQLVHGDGIVLKKKMKNYYV